MKTNVFFVLDQSGSMGSVRPTVISSFNEYIETLKGDGNKYQMSLWTFNTHLDEIYTGRKLKDVELLTYQTYCPSGGTALYDSVCTVLDTIKIKKKQKYLCIVMTDGAENASREYDEKDLKDRMEKLKDTDQFTFVFLGANQDAWATAGKFGGSVHNTVTYDSTIVGTRKIMRNLANQTGAYASSADLSTEKFFKEDKK